MKIESYSDCANAPRLKIDKKIAALHPPAHRCNMEAIENIYVNVLNMAPAARRDAGRV